jgi:RNA polymerase primary sigma factor
MRLAESHGVAREDFLRSYRGSELDPRWLNRASSQQGLEAPRRQGQGQIKHIATISNFSGRPRSRSEFLIVHMVKGRARSAPEEGDGGGEFAPRDLDREGTPTAACSSRSDQEGNIGLMKAVDCSSTTAARVCDLCDLVGPASGQPLDRRPGAPSTSPCT